MAIAVTVLHILPGKTPDFIEFTSDATGPRFVDHEASRMRLGIRTEKVWIEPTNAGDMLILFLESEDMDKSLGLLAASDDSYDLWYKERFLELTSVDLSHADALKIGELVFESPEVHAVHPLESVATVMPLQEGMSAFWLLFLDELKGLRADDYRAYLYRYGLSGEKFFLFRRPGGSFVVLYAEGRHPAEAIARFARSHHPFDVWMREQMLYLNGIDFIRRSTAPRPSLVLDWKAATEHVTV